VLFRRLASGYGAFTNVVEGHVEPGAPTEQVVTDLFTRPDRPTALVIGSVHTAPPTIRKIRALGLRIPQDVSVVMFGHTEWTTALEPPINALGVDPFQYGTEAAIALIAMVHHEPDAQRVIRHYFTYVRRGSIAPPGGTTVDTIGASPNGRRSTDSS
jgi:LacI family transcriptional regulator